MMNPFTGNEMVILHGISDKYKWIARDRHGALFVYEKMPKRQEDYYNVIDDDNWVGRKDINGNEIEQLTWGQLSDDIQNKLIEHYYNVVFPALFDRFYIAYYEHTLYYL